MDTGGLAQMSHSSFSNGALPSGLASRRGGQALKPLSFDAFKNGDAQDNGAPTPRTSRSHLLAGLRTAPKSATAATFPTHPASPTTAGPRGNRNSMGPGMLDSLMNGPRTSMPQFRQQQQQQQPQQQSQQSQSFNPSNRSYGVSHQYTTEQILAPPQVQVDEQSQESYDPSIHAQLMMANAYLTDQQQRLQQQLRDLQAAAQQFQGLNVSGQMPVAQGYSNLYQQQLQAMQQMTPGMPQSNVYAVYDPVTGQQSLYVDQSQMQAQVQAQAQAQAANQYLAQAQLAQMQQQQQMLQNAMAPRFQVSPPPENSKPSFRNTSPPRRFDSPIENPTPLPPPSANAFRRGHKKSNSLVNKGPLSIGTDETKVVGPKTASFPLTPMTLNGYAPGQARAGEHPIRQPHNPPNIDELKARPTSKHEGSKNFVARMRRSAVRNIMRAGLERRKDVRSSGSISPISESTEEMVETPMTDNDSDSGRSGSGSLVDNDDAECSLPSSRTSTGSWGAIGSDRPSSRQKIERTDSGLSDSEANSFASLLKNGMRGVPSAPVDGRKAAMLVLTSAEKRKVL